MSSKVISFHYKLTDGKGKTLDSSEGREPLSFMEGAGQIIPGLENALMALKVGDKKKILVVAAEAYGEHEAELVVKAPKDQLPTQEVKIGDKFRGGTDDHSPVFTVVEISGAEVTLDGNHPLAGQDLTFDVEIAEVRSATEEEIQHGHAHGHGGHSH